MKPIFSLEKWNLHNSTFPIGVALLLAFIARVTLVGPLNNAVDDYALLLSASNLDPGFCVSLGRWGEAIIVKFVVSYGLDYAGSSIVFSLLFALQLLFTVHILIRSLHIKINKWAEVLLLSIAVLHPYFCELFTYKCATMLMAISFAFPAMGAGYLLLSQKKVVNKLIGVLLIVWAMANYQVSMNLLLVFIPFQFLFNYQKNHSIKETFKSITPQIAWFFGAIALYFATYKLSTLLTGVAPNERTHLLPSNLVSERLNQLVDLYHRIFFENEAIASAIPKWTLLGLTVILLVHLVNSIRKNSKTTLKTIALLLCVILFSALGILGTSLILDVWWSTPRLLSGIGFFWALLLLFTLKEFKNSTLIYIPLAVVVFFFMMTNNRILSDQSRMNLMDYMKANRIVAQIEQFPDFQKKKLIVFPRAFSYQQSVPTMHMDMNMSALYPSFSKIELLEFVSGYDFIPATSEEEATIDLAFPNRANFPADNSVFETDEFIVVQL